MVNQKVTLLMLRKLGGLEQMWQPTAERSQGFGASEP